MATDLSFEADDFDKLIISRLRGTNHSRLAFVGFGVITVILMIVVNWVEGTLLVDRWPSIIYEDWKRLLGFKVESEAESHFPLERDLLSVSVVSLQIVNLYIIFKQWDRINHLGRDLQSSGVLDISPDSRLIVEETFASVKGWLNSTVASFLYPLAVGLATLYFYSKISDANVFRGFADRDLTTSQVEEWSHTAYNRWWAHEGAGQVLFLILSFVILYYVILQNLVGFAFAFAFWRIRKHLNLSADIINQDGFYGWKPVSALLATVYHSLIVNSISVFLILVVLQGAVVGGLGPFLGLVSVAGLVYPFVPYRVISVRLREFKDSRREQILDYEAADLSALSEGSIQWLRARSAIRAELEALHSVPVFPGANRLIAGLAFQGLPISVAVLQLVAWIR